MRSKSSSVRKLVAGAFAIVASLAIAHAAVTPAPTEVTFPSRTPGLRLQGILYQPSSSQAPAIVIMSGTSGREGFANWETPWALRLQRAGYVALIVDSFTPRGLAFSQHWRLSRQARGSDALDAGAFLAGQSFVRSGAIGVIGRSGGGSAVLAAIVAVPGQSVPFKMAVADYGYCQLSYGSWKGGATVYRTSVPLLITIGTDDTHVPVASCVALAANARRAGEAVTLQTYASGEHAFDTLYGNGTPAQQADVINRIASFIERYVGAGAGGQAIHASAADFRSRANVAGGAIVVRMRAVSSSGASGTATLTQQSDAVDVAINLAEGVPPAFAQIRQGSCAQLYPEVAYRIAAVINGSGSGRLQAKLADLMNGHSALVVVPTPQSNAPISCADIPRNT
jgi:dienelactone hydrolase